MKFLLFSFLAFGLYSHAQDETKLKITSDKPIIVDYKSHVWNKSKNQIDFGFLVLKNALSNKLAIVELAETSFDSEDFNGKNTTFVGQEITPEIYLPARTDLNSLDEVERQIESGKLIRKPFFIHHESNGSYVITVYDTREQAYEALALYQKTRTQNTPVTLSPSPQGNNPTSTALSNPIGGSVITPDLIDKQAQQEEVKDSKTEDQKMKELDEQEKQRMAQLAADQAQLSEEQKNQQKATAQALADQAMKLYKEGLYAQAEEKFSKSVELDPTNTKIYYNYGVTLYKDKKYEKAITALNLAEGDDINFNEKKYFMALSYLKVKDYDKAADLFDEIKTAQDPNFAPNAAFYKGVIYFQKENYEKSKSEFQYVLDNSKNPSLDKQADNYIDQIINISAFKETSKYRFSYALNLGLMYDSNVLSTSNSALQGGATNSDGFKLMYSGSLDYKFIYTPKQELSANIAVSDQYTVDNGFQYSSQFRSFDPLTIDYSLPYKYKTQLFALPYQLTITPTLETINMDQNQVGQRQQIVNSEILRFDNTFVTNKKLFSNYYLTYRRDNAMVPPDQQADDQNEYSFASGSTQTYFLDQKKVRAYILDANFTTNQAVGANQTYNRIDLSGAYQSPWRWNTIWSGKFEYYYATYPNHTVGRTDNDLSLTLALTKPIKKSLSTGLTGSYILNSSSYDVTDYKKYYIMTNLTYAGVF